jgi:hypothetical protein
MHFTFPYTVSQVLWALTFAAQLVLLVVLLGRDRAGRYPWFTASIAVFALRLLTEVLLSGRMAIPTLRIIFITMADFAALVGLLVVVEIARRAFAGASRRAWIAGALAFLVVSGGVLAVWGPWPPRRELILDSPLAVLRLMQILAQKADLLYDLLAVQLGLLVVFFGRQFKAGWRSHTQRIVIGLSTVAASWLIVEGVWQIVAKTVHPHSQAEYERIIGLGGKLVNANKVVYLVVLIWWIACLWIDEPGQAAVQAEPGPHLIPEAVMVEEYEAEQDSNSAGDHPGNDEA